MTNEKQQAVEEGRVGVDQGEAGEVLRWFVVNAQHTQTYFAYVRARDAEHAHQLGSLKPSNEFTASTDFGHWEILGVGATEVLA